MRRRIAGLHDADQFRAGEVPDGLFLVHAHKPYNWFLRDFGYEAELLGRDEIDDKNLVGLRGVVKISHAVVNGTSLLNLDGFAPAAQWEELSTTATTTISSSEVA
jgi:hypothetical protein